MPWSIAAFKWFRLSVGLSLLSMPMTSNFTPAGLVALNFSAKNCRLLSWLVPTGPIRPDSGSIHIILTVCPASGLACAQAPTEPAASAAPTRPRVKPRREALIDPMFIRLSPCLTFGPLRCNGPGAS